MDKRYTLTNALTLNATGNKYNAVAAPVSLPEIRRHAMHFSFNFSKLKQDGFIVYKICREGDEDIWQGLVGFRYSPGILDCANMETSNMNKSGMALYGGTGKAIVALCCKISFDWGLDGYITFDAKHKLIPYYKRLGAIITNGNRMAITTGEALKLTKKYF